MKKFAHSLAPVLTASSTTNDGPMFASYVASRPDGRASALTVESRKPWKATLLNDGLSIALEWTQPTMKRDVSQ